MLRVRKKRQRRFVMPEVSLTPLIDTALTLLVIFMVTAPMIQHNIKVDLPQASSKEAGTEQEFVVVMNKEGSIFFNSFPVEQEKLATTIKDALTGKGEIPVYVRADEALSYGKIVQLVDELKTAGVRFVALSTRSLASGAAGSR